MSHKRFYAILTVSITLLTSSFAHDKPASMSIIGKVFDRQTKEPIPSANVVIVGTTAGGATDEHGDFTITNVGPGQYQVRVSVLGYKSASQTVSVSGTVMAAERSFPMDEENITIGVVEVMAAQFSSSPEAPLSTRSFSAKELQNTAGGLDDVVRAIKTLPGVAQTRADRTDLIVRGGAPSENLILVDNIEIPYINHFSTQGAGGGATAIIDMDLLNSTSFSTGGFGVRFGDKLSSVLSVGIRDGRSDAIHSKATLSATQFGLNSEGPLSGSGSYLVSVRKSYLDLVFKAYGFGFAPQYVDFCGKVTYSLGNDDKITVLAIGATDKMDLFNDTDEHRYQNSQILFSDQNHFVAGATWRHLSEDGYATITIRHARSAFEFSQFDEHLTPRFQSSSTETESSVRGEMVLQYNSSTELSFGAEFKSVGVESSIDSKWGGPTIVNHSLEARPGKSAAYAQISKSFDQLTVTVGLRGDYCSLIEQKVVVAPRISSILRLSPATNIALSAGRYYQTPSNIWLAGQSLNRELSFIGANQFVIGIHHLVAEDLNVTLEGYLKQYFNYPVSLARPNLIMANTGAQGGGLGETTASFGLDALVSRGSGYSRGIEFSMQKKLSTTPCYGVLSVSYSQTQFRALDGVSRPSDFDQRFMLNVGGGYVIGESWEVSGKFRIYTGRPYTPYDANGNPIESELNSARVDLNHQLDIRVARRWALGSSLLETYIDIQNVYNRKPVDAPIFNARTQRTEQMAAMGIVPTIGLALQF